MYELALAFSVFCLVVVGVFYIRSPNSSIFHPFTFYLAFHGFLFVFRPIVGQILNYKLVYFYMQFTPSPDERLTVILASNLGFLSFAYFCLRAGNVPMRFKQDAAAVMERNVLSGAFMIAMLLCLPIGAYSLATSLSNASQNFSTMVMDADTGTFVNTTSTGYLTEAQLMLATCAALFAWFQRFRLWSLLPLLAFIVLRAGTGGRGPFVTAAVSLAMLWLYEQRRRVPNLRAIAIGIGVIAAFVTIGVDRGESVRAFLGQDNAYIKRTVNQEKFMEGYDFANLEFFEYIVYSVPKKSGAYNYFLDQLQVFTEPVPRILWKDKPQGPPFNNIYLLRYGNAVGMTYSLPGAGWMQLGWIGVIIMCAAWGWALGFLYKKFVQSSQTTLLVAAYIMFLPTLIVALRDGQLVTVLRQGVFFQAPILITWAVARLYGIPTVKTIRERIAARNIVPARTAAAASAE